MSNQDNTRTRLLKASAMLFSKNAFNDVTTRQIADKANTNISSIKYYFSSKEELFIETVRGLLTELKNTYNKEMVDKNFLNPTKEEAVATLAQVVRSYIELMYLPRAIHPCKMVYREVLSLNKKNKKLCSEMLRMMIEEFSIPFIKSLDSLLSIVAPSLTQYERQYSMQIIDSISSHYLVSSEILKQMNNGVEFTNKESVSKFADYVIDFILRGLGVEKLV